MSRKKAVIVIDTPYNRATLSTNYWKSAGRIDWDDYRFKDKYLAFQIDIENFPSRLQNVERYDIIKEYNSNYQSMSEWRFHLEETFGKLYE